MFDIFYVGDNPELVDRFPFAKQVADIGEAKPRTVMYWFVEPNVKITDWDVFEYRPPQHDQIYDHNYKWDASNYGGVYLMADERVRQGVKSINRVVCSKAFPVLRQLDPGDYFEKNPWATHVWCVDPDYKITDEINWAPSNFEPDYIHTFHLRGQLAHKYPDSMGGARLYPHNWRDCDYKIHGVLDAAPDYPVLMVEDPSDYSQRDHLDADYVWLIDREHKIQDEDIDWVPDVFEESYIHVFRMPYQLTHKYPKDMGGVRLVPKAWRELDHKIHKDCPVRDVRYDVFYVDDDEVALERTYRELAERSRTEWFWVVDRDYDFNADLVYVPHSGEEEYIHLFKVPGHLDFRYDPDVTDVWDDRVSGLRLVPKHYDFTQQKYHIECPLRYDIFYADNPRDWVRFRQRARSKMFWVVDREYEIAPPQYLPHRDEQRYVINFKVPGQLEHKYTDTITNVSDNRVGGLVLAPLREEKGYKFGGYLGNRVEYETFSDEDKGRIESVNDWFWVVDPGVEVLSDFDFDFVPSSFDQGKTHVWQKLNPVTGKVYDYGGVMLCPREPKSAGRPKYMRSPACTQKPYPVYHIEPGAHTQALQTWYEARAQEAKAQGLDGFWVVDTYTQLDPQWEFDIYPTQWDRDCVHVFENDQGEFRGVRWVPVSTFLEGEYTDKEIANNSFAKLKETRRRASVAPEWPVVQLLELSRDALYDAIRSTQAPFVITVDPYVDADLEGVTSFMPAMTDLDRVHLWQRVNPRTGKVWGYGGVRLWPTARDYADLTSEAVRVNKLKKIRYVREPAARDHAYDIVFISYHEPFAEAHYANLVERFPEALWVKDVEGIFAAHKQAAELASTPMFWVVDADAVLDDQFAFDYMADPYDRDVVHVWNSHNPVTGDTYGYGGVKLFPRHLVQDATSWGLDFTTGLSSRYKEMPETASTTLINDSSWSAWKSAFREAAKLALKSDSASKKRLSAWLEPREVDNAEWAQLGAQQGRDYALANRSDPVALAKINDRTFLEELYDNQQR